MSVTPAKLPSFFSTIVPFGAPAHTMLPLFSHCALTLVGNFAALAVTVMLSPVLIHLLANVT